MYINAHEQQTGENSHVVYLSSRVKVTVEPG